MSDINRTLDVEIPVVINVAEKTMTVKDVLALQTGETIHLDRSTKQALPVVVNNQVIGAGKAVRIGGRLGVELTEFGAPKDIIQSLAGGPG
ncbi:MAG: FliM/FliN family flagellar motor switch protein [Planctomycetes bacterium]|nr:FliM/FliN family flagellar motor switch protein [Planctomycetota bacterium]